MIMIEKLKNNKKAIVLLILILFMVCIGISYAYWFLTHTQSGSNQVVTDCFDIEFVEETDAITLSKAYPMTDQEGSSLTPYTFKISNKCAAYVSYQINLEILNTTTLDSQYVKEMLDTNAKVLTENEVVKTTLENATTSYKLATEYLDKNEEKTHIFRLWIDESVGTDDPVSNKTFEGKITITASYVTEISKYHTITFNTLGGGEIDSLDVPINESMNENFPVPVKSGDTFLGWTTASGELIYPNTIIESDMELYAFYEQQKLIIFHPLVDNTVIIRTVPNGGTIEDIPIPIKEGHQFNGWYTIDGVGPLTSSSQIFQNYVLYATWDAEATIVFDSTGGSLVDPISIPLNTTIDEIPIPTKTDSEFLGWFTKERYGPLTSDMIISGSYNLHAIWATKKTIANSPALILDYYGSNDEPVVIVSNGMGTTKRNSLSLGLTLNKQGFATILLDNAGHGEFAVSNNTVVPDLIKISAESIDKIIQNIKDSQLFDGNKVATMGMSMGGLINFYQASFLNNPPTCLVSIVSIPDYAVLKGNNLIYQKYVDGKLEPATTEEEVSKINNLLDAYSPITNISKLANIPTFMINGTNDEYMPITSVREYVTTASKLNNKIRLLELEGETHTLSSEAYNIFLPEVFAFLKENF